ncbi:hypothetical protein AB0J47_22160 [Nocardia sp. NPDC049737]|uniref:hypothetical protein n=1 Tax=Nocardia sp. NPDC049737 TaxID=3154358 RepID=UPI0034377BC4
MLDGYLRQSGQEAKPAGPGDVGVAAAPLESGGTLVVPVRVAAGVVDIAVRQGWVILPEFNHDYAD